MNFGSTPLLTDFSVSKQKNQDDIFSRYNNEQESNSNFTLIASAVSIVTILSGVLLLAVASEEEEVKEYKPDYNSYSVSYPSHSSSQSSPQSSPYCEKKVENEYCACRPESFECDCY